MRFSILAVLLVLCFACIDKKKEIIKEQKLDNIEIRQKTQKFQAILDASEVKGSILIYDPEKNTYYSNDFEWAKTGKLPASTFKITNSIIALEIGVVKDDSTLFKWDGKQRALNVWEQNLTFREAFHFSCVPCYQDIARRIGSERMNAYLSKFEYGNMKVDATNIDMFWLEGASEISQFQQIDFLNRFYEDKLPISERTYAIMKRIMVIEENEEYTLSGKTGWSVAITPIMAGLWDLLKQKKALISSPAMLSP